MKVKIEPGPEPGTYKLMPPYGFVVLMRGKKSILQLAENVGFETQDLDAAIQHLDAMCGLFVEYEDTIKFGGKKVKFAWNPKSAEAKPLPEKGENPHAE